MVLFMLFLLLSTPDNMGNLVGSDVWKSMPLYIYFCHNDVAFCKVNITRLLSSDLCKYEDAKETISLCEVNIQWISQLLLVPTTSSHHFLRGDTVCDSLQSFTTFDIDSHL